MSAIDLFYARPSCESCQKVRARLAERGVVVRDERSTREPFSEAEVVALLDAVREVWLTRGRKVDERPAAAVRPDDLRGPTGGFRAPMLRRGRRLLVGFDAATVDRFLE